MGTAAIKHITGIRRAPHPTSIETRLSQMEKPQGTEKDPELHSLLLRQCSNYSLGLRVRDVSRHVYFSQGYMLIHMTSKKESRLLCSGLRFWLALGNVI